MIQLKIITLLLVACLADQQRIVGCNEMETRLESVYGMMVDLEKDLDENIRASYLDQAAQEDENYPLLTLAANVEESEAILCAFQRRGLLIAEEIINDYFIDNIYRLNTILARNEYLVDLIIQSLVAQSIEKGLHRILNYRKKIYLLSQVYEGHPGILDLSQKYFRNIKKIREKETKAREEFERSLNGYRGNVPFFWSQENSSGTLAAINGLIQNTEHSVDQKRGMQMLYEEQLLRNYALKPRLIKSIRVARLKSSGKIIKMGADLINSVDMKKVLLFEEKAAAMHEEIASYIMEVDTRLAEIERAFREDMQLLLYQPQQVEDTFSTRAFRVLSPIIAESEAVMHADECRMLLVIKDMLDRYSTDFVRIFETNKNLINLVKLRLIKHAISNTLSTDMENRKRIVLILTKNELEKNVRPLAREYFWRVQRRKIQVENFEKSEKIFERDASAELSPEVLSNTMNLVDDFVQKGIKLWFLDCDWANQLIKLSFDPRTRENIELAKKNTYNRIRRPTNAEIDSLSPAVVAAYEEKFQINISACS